MAANTVPPRMSRPRQSAACTRSPAAPGLSVLKPVPSNRLDLVPPGG